MYGGCKDKQDPMRQRDLTEKCPRFIKITGSYELEDRVAQRQSRLKQLHVRWPVLSGVVFQRVAFCPASQQRGSVAQWLRTQPVE